MATWFAVEAEDKPNDDGTPGSPWGRYSIGLGQWILVFSRA